MPSPVDLIVGTMLALQAAALPTTAGPRATSNEGRRYDAIGYAGVSDQPTGVAHAELPTGAYVEVTALDSGRTVLLEVAGPMAAVPGQPVALSVDAMRQLGVAAQAPVRVRSARAMPTDIAALNASRPADARLDAPPALLAGLRKALPARVSTPVRIEPVAVPVSPSVPPAPARRAAVASHVPVALPASGWGVQVAALSNEARARSLASQLGARVRPAGALFRIQLGPFANRAAADAARARVARQGQPQAALIHIP